MSSFVLVQFLAHKNKYVLLLEFNTTTSTLIYKFNSIEKLNLLYSNRNLVCNLHNNTNEHSVAKYNTYYREPLPERDYLNQLMCIMRAAILLLIRVCFLSLC
jgi:hypothetical protein